MVSVKLETRFAILLLLSRNVSRNWRSDIYRNDSIKRLNVILSDMRQKNLTQGNYCVHTLNNLIHTTVLLRHAVYRICAVRAFAEFEFVASHLAGSSARTVGNIGIIVIRRTRTVRPRASNLYENQTLLHRGLDLNIAVAISLRALIVTANGTCTSVRMHPVRGAQCIWKYKTSYKWLDCVAC